MARLTRDESRTQTRERLLASAARAFARSGYGGASIDEIAEDAGYSKGAFYSNFPSKEAIFLALLEEHKLQQIAAVRAMLDTSDVASLMQTLGGWLDGKGDEGDFALLAVEIELQARRSATLSAGYEALQARFQAELVAFIQAVFARLGLEPPAPVDEIAATFVAIANGCALQAGAANRHAGRSMRLFLDMVLKASSPAKASGA